MKRVVGLEGDEVVTRAVGGGGGGGLGKGGDGGGGGGGGGKVVKVDSGKVWVEGDEGFWSVDSNVYGAVGFFFLSFSVSFEMGGG